MLPKKHHPKLPSNASTQPPSLDYRNPVDDPSGPIQKFLDPTENAKSIKEMAFELIVGGLTYIIAMGVAIVAGFAIAWWSVKGCG